MSWKVGKSITSSWSLVSMVAFLLDMVCWRKTRLVECNASTLIST